MPKKKSIKNREFVAALLDKKGRGQLSSRSLARYLRQMVSLYLDSSSKINQGSFA